jgi:hypothetical protein
MDVFVVALILCGYIGVGTTFAQEIKADVSALTSETQKMSQRTDEMTTVWWIPEEFWRASFAQAPMLAETQVEEFLKVLRPYTLIAVIDGKIGMFGGITFKSEAEIRAHISIKDNEGTFYEPLREDQIDADIKNFLSMMTPLFANMLGPMGQNMHFFLFPAAKANGQKIADAKKEGLFFVKLGEQLFSWRLPLGSLLPQKLCSVDGEKLNGAWKFCPWHGVELKEPNK